MRISAVAVFAALLPMAAAAATYRWTDERGQVHYSQVPPAGHTYEAVGDATPPAPSPNQDSLNQAQTKGVKDETERKAADARSAQEKAQREERCKQALERLAYLDAKTARRLVKDDGSGNSVRLSEEEFQQRRTEAQDLIKKDCAARARH
jgi:hypothetical protein